MAEIGIRSIGANTNVVFQNYLSLLTLCTCGKNRRRVATCGSICPASLDNYFTVWTAINCVRTSTGEHQIYHEFAILCETKSVTFIKFMLYSYASPDSTWLSYPVKFRAFHYSPKRTRRYDSVWMHSDSLLTEKNPDNSCHMSDQKSDIQQIYAKWQRIWQ